MACGVPCIATDVGESRAIVGDCGTIVTPNEAEELGEAIAHMSDMPASALKSLGQRARARIQEHYSVDAVASASLAVIERAIAQREK